MIPENWKKIYLLQFSRKSMYSGEYIANYSIKYIFLCLYYVEYGAKVSIKHI